jgi:hypothetical protein
MDASPHLSHLDLEAGLDEVRRSPSDAGVLRKIVRRPVKNGRESLAEGRLVVGGGLEGDCWNATGDSAPEIQLTLMNSRLAQLVAGSEDRWDLAGDQLYVDLDLSGTNLPPGTRLRVGEAGAVIEITAEPHNGCGKFRSRFGADALRFVNSREGKALHLRGLYAQVVQTGIIRPGDRLTKEGEEV